MSYCTKCGAELGETAKFCASCGQAVNEPVVIQSTQKTFKFDFKAILGGFAGSALMQGIKRGLYSNEAGVFVDDTNKRYTFATDVQRNYINSFIIANTVG